MMQRSTPDPIARAKSLIQSGALTEARRLVKLSLAENPASASGLTLAGHIAIRHSNLDDAIRNFGRAIRADGQRDSRALLNLARAQEMAGRATEALVTAEEAATRFPDDPKTRGFSALLLAAGRPSAAAAALRPGDVELLDADIAFRIAQRLAPHPEHRGLELRLLARVSTMPGRFMSQAALALTAALPPADPGALDAARRALVLIPDAVEAVDAVVRVFAVRNYPVKRAAWLWQSCCLQPGDVARLIEAAKATHDVKWPLHGIAANRLLLSMRPATLGVIGRVCALYGRHHELSPDKAEVKAQAVAWGHSVVTQHLGDPRILDAVAGMFKNVEAFDEAYELWPRIISRFPGLEALHYNRGLFLDEQERLDDATHSLRSALVLKPDYQKAANILSLSTARSHDLNASLRYVRWAITVNPKHASCWINYGSHLRAVGRYTDALDAFGVGERLGEELKDQEQAAAGRFNRGMTHVSIGELQVGFNLLEARWATRGFPSPKRKFRQAIWRGPQAHPKTRLLAYMEQGLGDEVMLSWYFPMLRRDTRRLVVDCDERLVKLFGRTYEGIEFIPRSVEGHETTRDPALRHKIPSLHVPQYYVPEVKFLIRESWDCAERRGHRFPARLVIDAERLDKWDRWLEDRFPGRRRLALSWRSKLRNRMRDQQYVSLGELAAALPAGVVAINLQYSSTDEEVEELRELGRDRDIEIVTPEGVDLTNDLEDVFAILQVSDAAVTPMISLAWMAGAVGCPGYVFRTSRERAIWQQFGTPFVPWAPSLRLFFRDPSERWSAVGRDIRNHLSRFLATAPERHR